MADVLKVTELARLKLTRNGTVLYDQTFEPTEESYSEHSADRVVLAVNMASPQQVNLGGVATGRHLILETDQTIKVGVDSTTNLWQISSALMLVGSFTNLYVQNESLTNTATVQVVVTD